MSGWGPSHVGSRLEQGPAPGGASGIRKVASFPRERASPLLDTRSRSGSWAPAYLDDATRPAGLSGASEGRRKLELVPELIQDSAALSEVGVELHAIAVPHGELPFGEAGEGQPGRRVPGPDLVRVSKVQLPLELSAGESLKGADEVAVDIVRMILFLDEGPIDEDLRHADVPELGDENLEVVHETPPPGNVPVRVFFPWTQDEHGTSDVFECQDVIPRREEAFPGEARKRHHDVSLYILIMFDKFVK